MNRGISLHKSLTAFVAVIAVLSFTAVAWAGFSEDDAGVGYTGLKLGYNIADPFVDMIYEEHPTLSVWHIAAYGGYDFGIVRVGGTLWHYSMSAKDDVWRVNGDDPIDQTYIEMGTNGIVGPTVDVTFDIPVHKRIYFTPGLGVGFGIRYGEITQYDYKNKPGYAAIPSEDLTESQVEPEEEDNGDTFTTTFPLFHLDLDWTFLIDDNWFATAHIGIQTFGPAFGIGVGYHF